MNRHMKIATTVAFLVLAASACTKKETTPTPAPTPAVDAGTTAAPGGGPVDAGTTATAVSGDAAPAAPAEGATK